MSQNSHAGWLALTGAFLIAVIDSVYLTQLVRQGTQDPLVWRAPFVAGFLALMASLAIASSWRRATRVRPLLLAISATGLVVLAALAAFSIGLAVLLGALPIVAAAVLSYWRTAKPTAVAQSSLGVVIALGILVAGTQLTAFAIACPQVGAMTGSGYAPLSGDYHWSCLNGELKVAPGFCNHGGMTADANGHVIAVQDC